jgi:hypothetical protein
MTYIEFAHYITSLIKTHHRKREKV